MLYGRVSKHSGRGHDGDPGARSVDQQLDIMLAQAAREQVTVVGPYRDDGISASRYANGKARAGWQQVMNALLSGQANELWTWEMSRASRDRDVTSKLLTVCVANNVLLNVGGKVHDPRDPDDGFLLDLQSALAVRESAATAKRIKRDVDARAAAGMPHGKIPYGYRREYDPTTRYVRAQLPCPDTAPILRELVARILAGESMYAIAADLNARGVPSPQTVREIRVHGERARRTLWRGDEIRDQVLSPTAAGLRIHEGKVVGDATWPALISAPDRAALLRLLRSPGRQQWFGPVKHLLTGIAECGVCGTPLRATKNRGYPSYACPGPDKRGASCVTRVRAPLDAYVTRRVLARLADPGLAADVAARQAAGSARTRDVLAEITGKRVQLAELEEECLAQRISAAAFGRFEARLLAEIAELERDAAAASGLPPVVLRAVGPQAAAVWEAFDLAWQRQVIRALFRVVVHRSGRPRGARGFDPDTVDVIAL